MSVRVYQLAKQLNIPNKELIELLKEKGLQVSSPSSSIPNIYADAFIDENKTKNVSQSADENNDILNDKSDPETDETKKPKSKKSGKSKKSKQSDESDSHESNISDDLGTSEGHKTAPKKEEEHDFDSEIAKKTDGFVEYHSVSEADVHSSKTDLTKSEQNAVYRISTQSNSKEIEKSEDPDLDEKEIFSQEKQKVVPSLPKHNDFSRAREISSDFRLSNHASQSTFPKPNDFSKNEQSSFDQKKENAFPERKFVKSKEEVTPEAPVFKQPQMSRFPIVNQKTNQPWNQSRNFQKPGSQPFQNQSNRGNTQNKNRFPSNSGNFQKSGFADQSNNQSQNKFQNQSNNQSNNQSQSYSKTEKPESIKQTNEVVQIGPKAAPSLFGAQNTFKSLNQLPPINELSQQTQTSGTNTSESVSENDNFVQKETKTRIVKVKAPVIVKDLAVILDVRPFRLIAQLLEMGIFASMNQPLDESVAVKISLKYGVTLEIIHKIESHVQQQKQVDKKAEKIKADKICLDPRPPVVCILGHVDHGKTTLLDTIRKTNVVAKEAGGITQHIGAYQITFHDKKITFIDTPGHAAFSKMRERGANVTDIAVLVVAADDGFMPQTDEALKFIQKANVPIVVAINKMDSKGANINKVKQQLQARGIASEDWGGDTLAVEVSALKGERIENLLEAILLQAEMIELKANNKCSAEGVIIETQIEQGFGVTASVIVQNGTLKVGDCIVCGSCYCKSRAIMDDKGSKIKEAGPATPVRLLGWSDVPVIGSSFRVVENEKIAKKEAEEFGIEFKKSSSEQPTQKFSAKSILEAIESIKRKVLKVILRADVQGSVEALESCLKGIKSDKVFLEVVSLEVGQITKSDIELAYASDAVVVGFNTKLDQGVQALAKHHNTRIIQHNIIYEVITLVKDAMSELLDPELKENKLGMAEIRQVFDLSRDTIAGCMITEGKITRDGHARLLRKKEIIGQGRISSIKRMKEDVSEVKAGYECGIQMSGNLSYAIGDYIECFEIQKIRPPL